MAIIWIPGIVGLTTAHNTTVRVQFNVARVALLSTTSYLDLGCKAHLVEYLVKRSMGWYVLHMSVYTLCLTVHQRLVDCPGGFVSLSPLINLYI